MNAKEFNEFYEIEKQKAGINGKVDYGDLVKDETEFIFLE